MTSDNELGTIRDNLGDAKLFESTLEAMRAAAINKIDQLVAQIGEVTSDSFQGEIAADYPERVRTLWYKKTAEIKALDTLADALNMPATPYFRELFQNLSELLDEIPKLEDAYALPGQNSAADRLYLMLQFKTTELGHNVAVNNLNRKEEEDRRREAEDRRKEEVFERQMTLLRLSLLYRDFGDHS